VIMLLTIMVVWKNYIGNSMKLWRKSNVRRGLR
jgi:hypothetical protein